MSIRPSRKNFSDVTEIWCVDGGRLAMHDGMPYDPIQRQGHRSSDIPKIALFKVCFVCHLQWELANDH